MNDFNDFGFTAVTEQELESVQRTTRELETTAATVQQVQDKLDLLYKAVQPLLTNLKQNPDKEYIYWPQRLSKVQAFEQHIKNIYES
jgi:hypothetical protein